MCCLMIRNFALAVVALLGTVVVLDTVVALVDSIVVVVVVVGRRFEVSAPVCADVRRRRKPTASCIGLRRIAPPNIM